MSCLSILRRIAIYESEESTHTASMSLFVVTAFHYVLVTVVVPRKTSHLPHSAPHQPSLAKILFCAGLKKCLFHEPVRPETTVIEQTAFTHSVIVFFIFFMICIAKTKVLRPRPKTRPSSLTPRPRPQFSQSQD